MQREIPTLARLETLARLVTAALVCLPCGTGCQRQQSAPPITPEASANSESGSRKSIPFGESFEQALSEAKRDGKRVLVYFTGDYCGWCRRMEAETHSDPRVIELAAKFVCVKVNISQQSALQERFSVYSIPRSLVITADGSPVDEHVGFQPPAGFAPWLEATLAKEPTTWPAHYTRLSQSGARTAQPSSPAAPRSVGADEKQADVVLCFVEDDPRKFDDAAWIQHADVVAYLQSKGFQPRIEHLYRWNLSDRWQQARTAHRLPDLIACAARNGLFRDLMKEQLVADAISTRLKDPGPLSVSIDFKDRWIWSVNHSPHAGRAVEAVWSLFEPRAGAQLGPAASFTGSERGQIEALAKNAAIWWSSGDLDALRAHWDERAPQRVGTAEGEELRDRRNYRVRVADTRLFGTGTCAIALIETRTEGELPHSSPFVSRFQRLGTPTLAILHRTPSGWRLLAVGLMGYDITVDAAELFAFAHQKPSRPVLQLAPAELLAPADGAALGSQPFTVKWRLPETGPSAPQYWFVQTVDDHGWLNPHFRRLDPSKQIGHFEETFHATCTAEIWALSSDGRLSFSAVKRWSNRAPSAVVGAQGHP